MRWYKHSPDKWLAGTRGMSFEQKGLHADLISLYIDRNGNVPDNDTAVAQSLTCNRRTYRKLKRELLKIQKLRAVDGKLVPNGCQTSLAEAQRFSTEQSQRGSYLRTTRAFESAERNSNEIKTSTKSTVPANQPESTYTEPSLLPQNTRERPVEKESKNYKNKLGEESPAGQPLPGPGIKYSRAAERRKDHLAEKDAKWRRAHQAWHAYLVRDDPNIYAEIIDMLAADPKDKIADRATEKELREPSDTSGEAGALVVLLELRRRRDSVGLRQHMQRGAA